MSRGGGKESSGSSHISPPASPVPGQQVASPPTPQGQPRPLDTIFLNFLTSMKCTNRAPSSLVVLCKLLCPAVQTPSLSPPGPGSPGLLCALHSLPPPCHFSSCHQPLFSPQPGSCPETKLLRSRTSPRLPACGFFFIIYPLNMT